MKRILLIPVYLSLNDVYAQVDKPNIIFIFCDDLGFADLDTYGSLWNQTPELDKI